VEGVVALWEKGEVAQTMHTMYVNAKMKPVETVPGIWERG
jgi:hypothetical protein